MQGSAAVVGPRKVPSRALALGTALSVLSACGVQIDDASDAAPGAAFDTAAWSSGGDAAIPGVVANGGASAATLSAFASAYAHAVCDHIGPCCQANGVAYAPGGCLVAREDQAETMLASVHGSTFSPAAAAACIAFMETAAKQCNDNELPYADPCGQLFVGTKQPGEPCTVATDCVAPPAGSSMQCAGVSQGDGIQLFCQVQAPPSKGSPCNLPPPAPVTTSCSSNGAPLTCSPANECQPLGAVGQPCGQDTDCVATASCVNGVCTAGIAMGGPCVPQGDAPCVRSSYCEPSSGTCVASKGAGQSCNPQLPQPECSGTCINGTCVSSGLANPADCGG